MCAFLSSVTDLAKRLVQHVVHFVHAELFLELADGGVLVDVNHLDAVRS